MLAQRLPALVARGQRRQRRVLVGDEKIRVGVGHTQRLRIANACRGVRLQQKGDDLPCVHDAVGVRAFPVQPDALARFKRAQQMHRKGKARFDHAAQPSSFVA